MADPAVPLPPLPANLYGTYTSTAASLFPPDVVPHVHLHPRC